MRGIALIASLAVSLGALPAAARPQCQTPAHGSILGALASALFGGPARKCEARPGGAEARTPGVPPPAADRPQTFSANSCRFASLSYDARGQALYQPARACSRG